MHEDEGDDDDAANEPEAHPDGVDHAIGYQLGAVVIPGEAHLAAMLHHQSFAHGDHHHFCETAETDAAATLFSAHRTAAIWRVGWRARRVGRNSDSVLRR